MEGRLTICQLQEVNMIQKYIYGTPIETGAVVQNIEETKADF